MTIFEISHMAVLSRIYFRTGLRGLPITELAPLIRICLAICHGGASGISLYLGDTFVALSQCTTRLEMSLGMTD
jgi:hypothetical protein